MTFKPKVLKCECVFV